jgi:dihydroorotase
MSDQISIIAPDDWHVHLRDGEMLNQVVAHTARRFQRAIVMPNLRPPVTTVAAARAYRDRIQASCPADLEFTPLMTAYLTDSIAPAELETGFREGVFAAAKLYPANATTNSAAGVTDLLQIDPVLETMARIGMPLLIHGEVTDSEIDIFDREAVFIERHLAATITPHHLHINRNAMFAGGLRSDFYCLPVAKRECHRQALRRAATSGDPRFFLGTDTAPHERASKESACGCAGIFNAPFALESYAQVFDEEGALANLEAFTSLNGPAFYNLPVNSRQITLQRRDHLVPELVNGLVPFHAGEILSWAVADASDQVQL